MTEHSAIGSPEAMPTANVARPPKSLIQRNRLRIRSLLMLVMPAAIVLTDRRLDGTAFGLALYGLGAVAIVAALLGRFWCYVYNSGARTRTVITLGPYSLCRNPIYLCSMFTAAGVGLLSQSLVLTVLFGGAAFLFYVHIVEGEEAKMAALHGAEYTRYREGTARYIPHFDHLSPGVIEKVPGAILMRKIPKLISVALIFPIVAICERLHALLGSGIGPIF